MYILSILISIHNVLCLLCIDSNNMCQSFLDINADVNSRRQSKI